MEEYLIKSIENIQSFFNLYVITFSSFGLLALIRYLNNKYYHDNTPLKFLDMPIYSEYFSLIFGILFFVFIVVLSFMFLQLDMIIKEIIGADKNFRLVKNIKLIHWIASPFSTKSTLFVFVLLISLGTLYSLVLGIGHLILRVPPKCRIPPNYYKWIGVVDLFVFCVSVTLMCLLLKYIFYLGAKIE